MTETNCTTSPTRRTWVLAGALTLIAGLSALFALPVHAADRSLSITALRGPAAEVPFSMVPGTVELDPSMEAAVHLALNDAHGVLPASTWFSVSGLRDEDGWAFISVVGLNRLDPEVGWRLDDATWWGLVLLRELGDGSWEGGVEGTRDFSDLLAEVPDDLVSARGKRLLDPLQRTQPAATYTRFPFTGGTSIYYGTKGVHTADYSSMWGTGTWKAVDLWSDGATGHSPNAVYAAATESITGAVCNDGLSVAIKTPGLIYAHLLNNSNLYTGKTFNVNDYIGALKTGSFSASCGYASQATGSFHLHWGFPYAAITADGWTLDPAQGTSAPWVKGSEQRVPGTWIPLSGGTSTKEVIVDDNTSGFTKYGSSAYWYQASIGYGSHMWWTYVNGTTKSNYAQWKPVLSTYGSGNYTVHAYIPCNYATSQAAKYRIYHQGTSHYYTINQNNLCNAWASLGTYSFSANGTEYVELSDATGEAPISGRMLGFDAVKFVKQ